MNRVATLLFLIPLAVLLLASCSSREKESVAPPASLWTGHRYDGTYAIMVDQPRALIDVPLTILVTGLEAGQPVTLEASATFHSRQVMESWATFVADANGLVDASTAQPLYGTYDQADAMGLFWSMQPVAQAETKDAPDALSPLLVTLTALAGDKILATTQIERLFVLDEGQVVRQPIDRAGLVGTLFYPAGPGRHATVIWLGGSEGGLSEGYAALLASRGYVALALAYFGMGPLPMELVEIPLEYCAQAIAWLKDQPAVDPKRIAVMGGSKGAELALLLAATYPDDVHGVIAYKPSSVVWMGLPRNPADNLRGPKSSWTFDGRPLPFVSGALTMDLLKLLVGRDAALRSSYERGLDNTEAVAAAAIPVERIAGPVLLISGTDDQLSPSTPMGEMVIERLRANHHPYPFQHLVYEGAGHEIAVPYVPMMGSTRSGHILEGGSPQANALASADSWPKVLALLELMASAPLQ